MIKKIIFLSIASMLWFSCSTKQTHVETLIAEVGNKQLYLSDIKDYFDNLSPEDSLTILTDYVNKWAKNQVVLLHAEKNLSESEKNVTKELDDYRTSLLIHKYEQVYIRQKMDTAVSRDEIEQFYNKYPDNFQLPGVLVKVLFIKAANDFASLDKIRQLYRSNREKDIEELSKIAMHGTEVYSTFNNEWINLDAITSLFPGTTDAYENRAIRMRYIEDSNDKYTYFLKINEISMKGSVAPLEHVTSDIKNIILNRRKTNLIRQMENTVFNDAINKNEIKLMN